MRLFTWLAQFTLAMEQRLAYKQDIDWRGWDKIAASELRERLLMNFIEGDWVDVANFAFFLWVKKQKKEKMYE